MIYWNQRMVIIGMVLIAVILIVISAIVSPQGDELLEKKASLSYSIMSEPSRVFNVDQEANIPTWFTASIALYTALMASLIASSMKSQGKKSAGWRGLACLFVYIALDEVGGLHRAKVPCQGEYPRDGEGKSCHKFASPRISRELFEEKREHEKTNGDGEKIEYKPRLKGREVK